MELKQMACPSCTGAVQVPTDMDRITCAYCGSELVIEYSKGDMNLSLAEKIKETLQEVGLETQGAIRESTGVTKAELQRLQIGQQIGTFQIQLSSIKAEIRALEREKQLSRTAKSQLKELRKEEQECLIQIRNLQSFLSDGKGTHQAGKSEPSKTKSPAISSPKKGCAWGCATYLGGAVVLGMIAIPLDMLFFNISSDSGTNGPFFSIANIIGFLFGVSVFLYFLFPNASIWKLASFRILFNHSKKLTNGGKLGVGCIGLFMLCCVCSLPAAISSPSTPTPTPENTSIDEFVSTPIAEVISSPTVTNTTTPANTPQVVPTETAVAIVSPTKTVIPAIAPSNTPAPTPTLKPTPSQEVLTMENNEDMVALFEVGDFDPFISEFAEKYSGRIIQFDGYIANMMPHAGYETRFDLLIYTGNYGESSGNALSFKFEDINIVSDLKLTGPNIPEYISEGQNLRITAEVEEYKEISGLFFLKPVSTEIRP